mmetsp:Transcript_7413/g.18617  ORF Transcript_7413/g.18617 Transcript_7413/m.18617 type:complete len:240 (+) Transcript_7413:337-1056(+)
MSLVHAACRSTHVILEKHEGGAALLGCNRFAAVGNTLKLLEDGHVRGCMLPQYEHEVELGNSHLVGCLSRPQELNINLVVGAAAVRRDKFPHGLAFEWHAAILSAHTKTSEGSTVRKILGLVEVGERECEAEASGAAASACGGGRGRLRLRLGLRSWRRWWRCGWWYRALRHVLAATRPGTNCGCLTDIVVSSILGSSPATPGTFRPHDSSPGALLVEQAAGAEAEAADKWPKFKDTAA